MEGEGGGDVHAREAEERRVDWVELGYGGHFGGWRREVLLEVR